MRALWSVALLVLSVQGSSAQQAGTATIEGSVVVRDTGAPIARAHVELRRAQPGPPRNAAGTLLVGARPELSADSMVVTTDTDGSFVIRDIPPGSYRLYATRSNGYVPGEYGQRTASGEGTPLTLGAGQQMAGVTLTMTPTGSITGLVTGGDGQPSGYAHVQALKAVYRDGRRTLTVVQLVQADDRGIYRLFWLPPGEYFVAAKPLDLRRSSEMMHIPPPSRFGTYEQQQRPTITAVNTSEMLADGSIAEGQYVPIFFPGTRNERAASAVRLDAGSAVGGVDINVAQSLVRTHRVRGRAINGATGQPVPASLQIIPQNPPAILVIPTGRAAADGTFDMWGALPGPGYLVASGPGVTGLLEFDVGGTDLEGVTLTLWPGISIPGRVRIDGVRGNGADLEGIAITLRRDPAVNGLSDPGQMVARMAVRGSPDGTLIAASAPENAGGNRTAADGSFSLNGVAPGTFAVEVAIEGGAYVDAIRLGARDVLRSGLRVDGPLDGELEVVIRPNGAMLDGTVTDTLRRAVANATVVAVPAGRGGRRDLYRSGTTDADGRFELRGLAPGVYEVFAWEHIEPGAWLDAEFLASSIAGRFIQVNEGTRTSFTLDAIPAPR